MLSYAINFIIVPCIFLMNNDQNKINIIESKWYQALIQKFNPLPSYHKEDNEEEEAQQADARDVDDIATP